MSDVFSGLPDLVLEEIAKHLVPPGTTAWKHLHDEVFPLRLLTLRFNHFLTSALLTSVTLRLHPLELDDPVAFLAFRRRIDNAHYSKRLSISRHPLPSVEVLNCGCESDRGWRCDAHTHERQNAGRITKYLGQALNVCRSGLEEVHISLRTYHPDTDVYHDTESRNTFFPLDHLTKATFIGERFHPIIQTVCKAARNLTVLNLESVHAPTYEFHQRNIPPMKLLLETLGTNDLVWLAGEIRGTRLDFQPRRLTMDLDVHARQTLANDLRAIGYLGSTGFCERMEQIAVTSAAGLQQTDKDEIEKAFVQASHGRISSVHWPI